MSRPSLQALAATLVCFFLLCAGTPGVRSVGHKHRTEKGRAQLHERLGTVFAVITIQAGWVNDHVRKPLAEPLWPIQQFFGIAQTWSLYAGVDKKLRRLEVHIDDELVYRSNDPTATWLAGPLGSRRIRPLLDRVVMRKKTVHWDRLTRFVTSRARQDFPHAASIRLLAVHQARTPQAPPRAMFGRLARSPDWTPVPLGPDGLPEAATDDP